jgi:hypothetical protein
MEKWVREQKQKVMQGPYSLVTVYQGEQKVTRTYGTYKEAYYYVTCLWFIFCWHFISCVSIFKNVLPSLIDTRK